jgi:hypothetical protein
MPAEAVGEEEAGGTCNGLTWGESRKASAKYGLRDDKKSPWFHSQERKGPETRWGVPSTEFSIGNIVREKVFRSY